MSPQKTKDSWHLGHLSKKWLKIATAKILTIRLGDTFRCEKKLSKNNCFKCTYAFDITTKLSKKQTKYFQNKKSNIDENNKNRI